MADRIAITGLTTGTPKLTDYIPGVDTTDHTQAPSGTTKKYLLSDEISFFINNTGLTSGGIVFTGTNGALTVNTSKLIWDNTNFRLAIGGSIVPTNTLTVQGGTYISDSLSVIGVVGFANSTFQLAAITNGILHSGLTGLITASPVSLTSDVSGILPTSNGGRIPSSVIGANQTLAVNNTYFCTSGGALSLALPTVSAVGDTITVCLDGSTSWAITQPNAASRIRFGNAQTTLGVGGSLASTATGDLVTLTCETANARWVVVTAIGNITVV